jgi:hypothetical protein
VPKLTPPETGRAAALPHPRHGKPAGVCRQERRAGDTTAQSFALSLGATWAGNADEGPPEPLDAAIIFAPGGDLVPAALQSVRKGGRVVCGGIDS